MLSAVPDRSWYAADEAGCSGVLYGSADKGCRNTEGTLNYQNRVLKFAITLTPRRNATLAHHVDQRLQTIYEDTILFTRPDGTPTPSLDADVLGPITYTGSPSCPLLHLQVMDLAALVPAGDESQLTAKALRSLQMVGSGCWMNVGCISTISHHSGILSFSVDSLPIHNNKVTIIPANTVTGGITIKDLKD